MEGLFALEGPLVGALESLRRAETDFGVPYPFDESQDLALLRRVAEKYPDTDVTELVDKFIAWCLDARPWENEKGKPVTIRWRSRIWTWAANEQRFRATRKSKWKGRTHFAAEQDHQDETVALDEW